jgi:type IV pilus assembly protein PilA
MKRIQQGFTLIELMIVVAIVGILAAIALPAYQDYTIRARVSEAAAAAGACKTSVAEYFASKATLPTSAAQAGCAGTDAVTQYVANTDVSGQGIITVTLSNDSKLGPATGGQLVLTPTTGAGNVISSWACSGTPQKYMPGSCR